MKLKFVQLLPFLILTGLLLSAFGSIRTNSDALGNPPSGSDFSVNPQETAEPTTPPIIETVLVPITGEQNNSTANNNTMLLVYVLIGIAGLAFLIGLVAILTRSNQAPTDSTHGH